MAAEIYDHYILFPNHQAGLLLHRLLRAADIPCSIAPTPREASSFCGMSILVTEANLAGAQQVIDEHNAQITGIARILRKTGVWNRTC